MSEDAENDFEVVDDEAEPEHRGVGYEAVRAKRFAAMRQAARRTRDWSLIASIVMTGVALQLVYMAARKFIDGNGAAGIVFCVFVTTAFAVAFILFRRYRTLAAAERELDR